MNTLLISLSLALLAGLIMSRAAKLVNLPAVTSYLVAGLIIGPYVLNILNTQMLDKTEIITSCALGFIAFLIGNEFRIKDLKTMGKQAFAVGIGQAVITTIIVDNYSPNLSRYPVFIQRHCAWCHSCRHSSCCHFDGC